MELEASRGLVEQAKVIAVVGMRDEKARETAAFRIPERLKKAGYRVIPVNPKIQEALGERAYPSLMDLPVQPDIVNVFRRPEHIPELAEEILKLPANKRPRLVWLQSGIAHPEAQEKLEKAGIPVVADACLGVMVAQWKSGA